MTPESPTPPAAAAKTRARPATPRFDHVATIYEPVERLTFGRSLEWCRFRYLSRLGDVRRALVLGDGDGRFTARLVASNPAVEVTAVDASAAMLARLDALVRAARPGVRVALEHADARSFTPTRPGHDLVATHFFLDCLSTDEVSALVARLAPTLAPGARWVVSEFAIPRGAGRWPARLLVRTLYLAFRLLTGLRVTRLPDHAPALERHGFVLVRVESRLCGLLRAELWEHAGRFGPPGARRRAHDDAFR